MKRKTIANRAFCLHSQIASATQPKAEDSPTHYATRGALGFASLVLFASLLLLAWGSYACLAPDFALADNASPSTMADEDSSEDSDDPIDSGDDGSEDPESPDEPDEPESSEPSEEPSSGSSPEEEEQEEIAQVGGIMLTVVDADIMDDGSDEGGLTAPQGDASFAGMKFNVYKKSGKLVKTLVVDSDGRAILPESDYLPLGTYTVKQVVDSARERGYKANKTWADKGKKVTIDAAGGIVDAGTCACKVMRGGLWLNMVDSDMYDVLGVETAAQGKASLAEAEFEVYNASQEPVFLGGKLYEPYVEGDNNDNRLIMKLTTDEWGNATTDGNTGVFDENRGLPWGTYKIKQTKVSEGYHVDEENEDDIWSGTARVYGEDRFGLDEPVREKIIRGGVKLKMVDSATEDGAAQGDATLKGATFEVVNDNGDAGTVVMDGKAYAQGDVMLKITTNKEGLATCAKNILPYGTYKVRMANNKKYRSYVYDKEWTGTVKVKKNDRRAGIGKNKTFNAKVARGGVSLTLLDKETREPVKGSKFEVVNASKKPVVVKGVTYAKGKVVLTFASDEEGIAKTARSVLPIGSYTLRESAAATGYELNKTWTEKFQVRKAKKIVNIGKVYEKVTPVVVESEPVTSKKAMNPILPILGVLLVAAAAAAVIIVRKRRQQEQELLEAALPLAGGAALTEGLTAGEAPTDSTAYDAEATRALIDDQATRALQASLAGRARHARSDAGASDASTAETVSLAEVPLVSQATQVLPTPQDAAATPIMRAAHARPAASVDESEDPTEPRHYAEAIEADQRTRALQEAQHAQDAQLTQRLENSQHGQDGRHAQDGRNGQGDTQEFGAVLPAVVTKSEQKRARRANRWGKRD